MDVGVIASGPYIEKLGCRAVMIRLGPDEYAVCTEIGEQGSCIYEDVDLVRESATLEDPFSLANRIFADLVVELASELDYSEV